MLGRRQSGEPLLKEFGVFLVVSFPRNQEARCLETLNPNPSTPN
jgi:hypothetical protein